MNQPKYITDCLITVSNTFKKIIPNFRNTSDYYNLHNVLLILANSEKFKILDILSVIKTKPGEQISLNDIGGFLKLPYPITALEYDMPFLETPNHISKTIPLGVKIDKTSKQRIALAIEINNKTVTYNKFVATLVKNFKITSDDAILIISFWYDTTINKWVTGSSYAYVYIHNNELFVSIHPFLKILDDLFEEKYKEEADILRKYDLLDEITSVLNVIKLFNEKNVVLESFVSNAKINKKRCKKDLPPYPSYKILTVKKIFNKTIEKNMSTNNRTHPRQHKRRGHIRHLKNGKEVWVSPCIVGQPEHGVVEKDYLLK